MSYPLEIERLYRLLHGHPYLTRIALFKVTAKELSSSDLFERATDDNGPFRDHLDSLSIRLDQNPTSKVAFLKLIQKGIIPDKPTIRRLQGAGLVREERDTVVPRCQLYADYFRRYPK
jgi:hypothetical protein